MLIEDAFSRRNKSKRPDVFHYDDMSKAMRVRVVHLIRESIGHITGLYSHQSLEFYDYVVKQIRKDTGLMYLNNRSYEDRDEELLNYILTSDNFDYLMNAVELSFRLIDIFSEQDPRRFGTELDKLNVIDELNKRFLEDGFGYQFQSGNIIRIDSQLLHAEAVVPVLELVSDPDFSDVEKEFVLAHEHYRKGHYEDAIVGCGKAFESTLKIIGNKKGWNITQNDTASKLVAAAYSANFIEPWMQASLTSLRSLLESSVPVVRNKMGGHGAGGTGRDVPEELVALQIHQTAAAILFLVKTYQRNP